MWLRPRGQNDTLPTWLVARQHDPWDLRGVVPGAFELDMLHSDFLYYLLGSEDSWSYLPDVYIRLVTMLRIWVRKAMKNLRMRTLRITQVLGRRVL